MEWNGVWIAESTSWKYISTFLGKKNGKGIKLLFDKKELKSRFEGNFTAFEFYEGDAFR